MMADWVSGIIWIVLGNLGDFNPLLGVASRWESYGRRVLILAGAKGFVRFAEDTQLSLPKTRYSTLVMNQ